jgi:hypothetical protein
LQRARPGTEPHLLPPPTGPFGHAWIALCQWVCAFTRLSFSRTLFSQLASSTTQTSVKPRTSFNQRLRKMTERRRQFPMTVYASIFKSQASSSEYVKVSSNTQIARSARGPSYSAADPPRPIVLPKTATSPILTPRYSLLVVTVLTDGRKFYLPLRHLSDSQTGTTIVPISTHLRIFTIGVNHAINVSSRLRNLSKACACFRNTFMTESGELEFSNAAANGCVSRSCFRSVLYSFDAASNIAVKLAVERSVV